MAVTGIFNADFSSFYTAVTKADGQLKTLTATTDKTADATANFGTKFRQVDGLLASAGVHTGPYARGLEDIASAAGKSATELGLLGTAGAALSAAVAGWKFGRMVAEALSLDTAIGNATAAMLGMGDVAAETAGAVQDQLARASKIAGVEVTNLTAATEILRRALETTTTAQQQAAAAAAAAAEQHTESMRREWSVSEGNAGALLATQVQLDALKQSREAAAKASFAHAQADTAWLETADFTVEVLGEQVDQLQAVAEASALAKQRIDEFMQAQTLNQRTSETVSTQLAPLSQAQIANVNTQFSPFNQGGNQGLLNRLRDLEAREGTYDPVDNRTFFQMQHEIAELAQLRLTANKLGIPGYRSGVENFRGGLAYVHQGEALVHMPPGTDVWPAGAHGGGAVTVNNTFNITGSTADIVRQVSDQIMRTIRAGTQVGM